MCVEHMSLRRTWFLNRCLKLAGLNVMDLNWRQEDSCASSSKVTDKQDTKLGLACLGLLKLFTIMFNKWL